MLDFNDAMEGLLRGLEASDGDLSDGRQRLREELARVRLDLPSSPVHLDQNRQVIRNTYLKRVARTGGRRAFQLVRVVPGVEQTFGGLLSRCTLSRPRQPAVPQSDSASLGALAARPNRPGEAGLAGLRREPSGPQSAPDQESGQSGGGGQGGSSAAKSLPSPALGEADDDET